ncbi:MAG: class I SAM-dependent methyltransferase [Chitinophagaceae bacterium]|nr:class I SAM-dependent methyltransferase [Chitinophagaceae bacterium]
MHSEYIDSLILRLCKQPRTFEFISKSLNGLDPIQLKEAIDRLEKKETLHKRDDMWSVNEKRKPLTLNLHSDDPQLYLKKYMGYFDFLKMPHPLDFEWRNSTASLNYLINEVQEMNSVNDRILFLGMPTLFATACIKDIPQKVTLVERNKPIVRGLAKLNADKERFQILEADIFKVAPKEIGKYYSVIMDPPWYSPHFYQFMWLAAQCVEVGGVIGISLPPINTRPDIDKERIDWFTFCQKHGLCLENLYAQRLHYAMPFFEFNAFRAAGIKDILPFWRKGDLALFRKVHTDKHERPLLDEHKIEWTEKEIDTVRIRVKDEKSSDNEEFKITHLIKGDILPTVSTRDKRRDEANVWTSGNRIYKVSNPKIFLQLLNDLENEKPKTKEQKLVADFINSTTELEKKEYNNYLDWLYHEMERQTD